MVVGALGLGKMDCEKLEKLNMIIDHESNYDCDPVKPKKKSWTIKRRESLYLKNPNCCYCNVLTVLGEYSSGQRLSHNHATIEHLTPIALGGSKKKKENLAIACYKCNTSKGGELSHKLQIKLKSITSNVQKFFPSLSIDFERNFDL